MEPARPTRSPTAPAGQPSHASIADQLRQQPTEFILAAGKPAPVIQPARLAG
ncbi:hypothetical protein [Plantactinospora sp. DSM 117369]